jgi:hypothetical protein
MAISLRWLEYFVTVADEGSFTAAAELLQVSQPGLCFGTAQAIPSPAAGDLAVGLPALRMASAAAPSAGCLLPRAAEVP